MADAQAIRDHVLSVLEQAALVDEPEQRACMLTFVIAGGASLRRALRRAPGLHRAACVGYPRSTPTRSGWCWRIPGRASSQVGEKLGEYAGEALPRRGVEVRCNMKVKLRDGALGDARRRRDHPDPHAGLDGRHLTESGARGIACGWTGAARFR